MFALFLSDIHCSMHGQQHLQALACMQAHINFCKQQKQSLKIYLLGDIFNTWLGNALSLDVHSVEFLHTCKVLVENNAHVSIYAMPGNRDFLLSAEDLKAWNIRYILDPSPVKINQHTVYLMHGDAWCLQDKTYLKLRPYLRNSSIQKLFFKLPNWIKLKIASYLRKQSKQKSNILNNLDIDLPALAKYLRAKTFFKNLQTVTVIHGHIHQAHTNCLMVDGLQFNRLSLSDWQEHQPAHYVWFNGKTFELKQWQIAN